MKIRLLIVAGALMLPAMAQTKSAKAAAPIDLTGYWVSVVTEDWRWRMVTPAKGDYASIPITPGAKKLADTWDPAKDEAAGEQCRSYGAPAIMRVPGRFHITWQDDNTLKVESDYGMQTRLFISEVGWLRVGQRDGKGDSVAQWEIPRNRAGTGSVAREVEAQGGVGSLTVETTHIRPGYLRKNGVPYGAKAKLTEYWDLNRETNGDQWPVITTLVDDPEYLQEQWVTRAALQKEADGAKWDPTPCSSKW